MAIAGKTILIALALAISYGAAAEEPQAAIVEGTVINAQNSRTIPRASVNLLGNPFAPMAAGTSSFSALSLASTSSRRSGKASFLTSIIVNTSRYLMWPPAST